MISCSIPARRVSASTAHRAVSASPVRVGRTIVWMHGIAGAHPCTLWARIALPFIRVAATCARMLPAMAQHKIWVRAGALVGRAAGCRRGARRRARSRGARPLRRGRAGGQAPRCSTRSSRSTGPRSPGGPTARRTSPGDGEATFDAPERSIDFRSAIRGRRRRAVLGARVCAEMAAIIGRRRSSCSSTPTGTDRPAARPRRRGSMNGSRTTSRRAATRSCWA